MTAERVAFGVSLGAFLVTLVHVIYVIATIDRSPRKEDHVNGVPHRHELRVEKKWSFSESGHPHLRVVYGDTKGHVYHSWLLGHFRLRRKIQHVIERHDWGSVKAAHREGTRRGLLESIDVAALNRSSWAGDVPTEEERAVSARRTMLREHEEALSRRLNVGRPG